MTKSWRAPLAVLQVAERLERSGHDRGALVHAGHLDVEAADEARGDRLEPDRAPIRHEHAGAFSGVVVVGPDDDRLQRHDEYILALGLSTSASQVKPGRNRWSGLSSRTFTLNSRAAAPRR